MAEITVRFGDGGANLNPAGTGKPTLATVLREIADDLALVASDTRFDEETVPIVSNVGLLYYPAESIELMDNAGAAVAQIASGAAPGAGEFKLAADRRTLTLGDAPADVIVAYIRKIETAPLLESAAEPWVLVDAFTLLVKVDGGAVQTALFETADFGDIGAATAAEVVAVINTDINFLNAYLHCSFFKCIFDLRSGRNELPDIALEAKDIVRFQDRIPCCRSILFSS